MEPSKVTELSVHASGCKIKMPRKYSTMSEADMEFDGGINWKKFGISVAIGVSTVTGVITAECIKVIVGSSSIAAANATAQGVTVAESELAAKSVATVEAGIKSLLTTPVGWGLMLVGVAAASTIAYYF